MTDNISIEVLSEDNKMDVLTDHVTETTSLTRPSVKKDRIVVVSPKIKSLNNKHQQEVECEPQNVPVCNHCVTKRTDTSQPEIKPIAPPLNENTSHHVVFIAHPNDYQWVTDVINRLQTPALGFKCWYQGKDHLLYNNHHQKPQQQLLENRLDGEKKYTNNNKCNDSNGDIKITNNVSNNLCSTNDAKTGISHNVNTTTSKTTSDEKDKTVSPFPFYYSNSSKPINKASGTILNGASSCNTNNGTHGGIRNSLKTVIVISKDFINEIWLNPDLVPRSLLEDQGNDGEGEIPEQLKMDVVLVLLEDCDIPAALFNIVSIDIRDSSWWTRLVGKLCSFDNTLSDERRSSLYSSATSANGYLIHSIKSRCIYCGQEIIDTTDVPQEFMLNGVRISQEDYQCALQHLMKDSKFRCHVWCYSVPAAIIFFTIFLGVCLTVIPLLEAKYLFKGKTGNGLEFVHGGVAWLCVLTGYMLVMHISKKKMKISTYHRLKYVNAILSKHKLLAGVENLGMADCNKYYLHFFYFDIGPCLMYLQELFAAMDEPVQHQHSSSHSQHQQQSVDETQLSIDVDDCDTNEQNDHSDLAATFTNANMQHKAEELILRRSGEYLNNLISKRLDRPQRIRHVKNYPCLCQYVEDHAYKIAL